VYSHKHGTITITPIEGPNAGVKVVCRSNTKASFDPAQKTTYGKGSNGRNAYIAEGSPEPKLSMDFSSGEESTRIAMHCGRGNRCTITHVYKSPNLPLMAYTFHHAKISSGGGYDSDDGAGVTGKLEWMMLGVERRSGAGPREVVV
jgi:hypothetical protein